MVEKTVIKPSAGWNLFNITELNRYRDLLYFLVLKGIKAKYAQSVLGIGWAILQPLMTSLIFTIIFGRLANLSSDGVPYILFSFVAMVPWTFFSSSLIESSGSLVQNRNLLTKVYFPRVFIPFAAVLSKLVDLIIGFIVLFIMLLTFGFWPNINLILLPLLLLILLMMSLGLAMLLSALSVQYRDVNYAMTFLVRLLMYGAPIVYSIDIIPEEFVLFYAVNPLVGVVEGFRAVFLETRAVPWILIIEGLITSFLLFLLGALYFKKMEKRFADIA